AWSRKGPRSTSATFESWSCRRGWRRPSSRLPYWKNSVANDPIAEFKAKQRETWTLGNFGLVATFTTQTAGHLVRFAGVRSGQAVLDVGCGTGPVAITAARTGAKVTGIDLTPELLAQARESAPIA